MPIRRLIAIFLFVSVVASPIVTVGQNPKYPDYPSETPDNFKPTNYGFEYDRRDVMIPMRDGVKQSDMFILLFRKKCKAQ